jgi:hypothetical protein
MPCSAPLAFGERLSCARSALGRGGAGAPYRARFFFGIFFYPKSEGQTATVRAGGLEEGQGMGQTSGNTAIHGRLANVSLAGQEFFFLLRVVLGHFFGLFPSVPIVTPKMPGVVIIKGPETARKKNN